MQKIKYVDRISTSISCTHIAALDHSRSHACLLVGETLMIFFLLYTIEAKQIKTDSSHSTDRLRTSTQSAITIYQPLKLSPSVRRVVKIIYYQTLLRVCPQEGSKSLQIYRYRQSFFHLQKAIRQQLSQRQQYTVTQRQPTYCDNA